MNALATRAYLTEAFLEKRIQCVLIKDAAKQLTQRLNDTQCGFRPGRSATDQQEIFQKSWGLCQDVYACFVDLGKAFDRLPRDKLWVVVQDDSVDGQLPLPSIVFLLGRWCRDANSGKRVLLAAPMRTQPYRQGPGGVFWLCGPGLGVESAELFDIAENREVFWVLRSSAEVTIDLLRPSKQTHLKARRKQCTWITNQ